jgi:predicted ATPase
MTGAARRELKQVLSWGPFRFFPRERRLEKNGMSVKIGDRALDILIALTSSAGEILSNRQLIEKVWPNSFAGESSLRVHMVAVRKALTDDQEKMLCIENIPGRGYRFVKPVSREVIDEEPNGSVERAQSVRIIGREAAIDEVTNRLLQKRFVTIVGSGGIGKTTVALGVTYVLSRLHGDAVHFIDLGMIDDPALVAKALAFATGVVSQSDNPWPNIKNALRDKKAIVVFDCCEHLVDEVARLAEELFLEVPSIKILATSRESLRAAGEQVYWLAPLEVPPQGASLTADETIRFSAVQLFVERASTKSFELRLSDADVMAVVDICRQLDGIALAIELAAGRVATDGISGVLELLQDRIQLLANGERAVPQRHQTLQATIDWSYNLLSDHEKAMLRRLSIFAGPFTFEAAQAIAANGKLIDAQEVFSSFAKLVAKSLIASDDINGTNLYRLLDTTRHYMRQKLVESGELPDIANCHVQYYQEYLPDFEQMALEPRGPLHAAKCGADIANVLAALQWCASQPETYRRGIDLVAASAPLFVEVSLFEECLSWVQWSIGKLETPDRRGQLELRLQTVLGSFLMFTRGNTEEARLAILRGLELADRLGDVGYRGILWDGLYTFYMRRGSFREGWQIAYGTPSHSDHDTESGGGFYWMRCVSAHFAGNHDDAIAYGEKLLRYSPVSRRVYAHNISIDQRIGVLTAYARSLWLRGFPGKSLVAVKQSILEAEELDHPISLCVAFSSTIPATIWMGELAFASEMTGRLANVAKKHLLTHFETSALAWQGARFIREGQPSQGVPLLQRSLSALEAERQALMRTSFLVELAGGQLDIGCLEDALHTIDEALHRIDQIGEGFLLPEALRIKAEIVLKLRDTSLPEAEDLLSRSLDHARKQSALSWELRSATSLTELKRRSARCGERNLLSAVLDRFTEGLETPDLRLARSLLES